MDRCSPRQKVGDDDDRELELFGEVEGLNSGVEAVGRILGGHDYARKVSLGGAHGLIQIALLGLCGNPGGRPSALDVDDDHRRLNHPRHPHSLAHKGEPAPRGGTHGTHTCMARTDG